MKTNRFLIARWLGSLIMIIGLLAVNPVPAEAAPNLAPALPTNLIASDGKYTDGIHLSWSFTPGYGYTVELWRNDTPSGTGTFVTSKSEFMMHNDTTVTPGATYYYRVRSCDSILQVCSSFTAWESGWRGFVVPQKMLQHLTVHLVHT